MLSQHRRRNWKDQNGSETKESPIGKVATFAYKKGHFRVSSWNDSVKVSNFVSEAMNHDEGWRSGGRGGPRGRSQASGQRVNRQKSERPVSKLDCRLVILFFSFSKL